MEGGLQVSNVREAVARLEEMIAEREVQKRHHKIMEDRQALLMTKSPSQKSPCPTPPGGYDQMMVFAKFEEFKIWERCFEYLTSLEDVTNAYLACDMFKKLLEEKRMLMQLPQIFAIFRDDGHLRYSCYKQKTKIEAEAEEEKMKRESLRKELVSCENRTIKDICDKVKDIPLPMAMSCPDFLESIIGDDLDHGEWLLEKIKTLDCGGSVDDLDLQPSGSAESEASSDVTPSLDNLLASIFGNGSQNTDVLNLRLVSKSWKKIAEQEFLLIPSGFGRDERWNGSCWMDLKCHFKCIADVNKAMEALGSSEMCPTLIRSLEVDDRELVKADIGTFYSKLSTFLDTHGKSVWRLIFAFECSKISRNFNYEGLWKIVSRMPNLKSLKLDGFLLDFGETKTLRQEMMATPFPTLSSLEHCDFFLLTNADLIVEILGQNVHVKEVEMSWFSITSEGIPDAVWIALRNLHLEKFALRCDTQANLLQLGRFHWPLKHLSVDCSGSGEVLIDGSRVFEFLGQFKDTLETVDLKLQIFNDGRSVTADFPKLKSISMSPIVDK